MPVVARARFVFLRAADRTCAVPIALAVETMRPLPAEPVAGMPPFVRGVARIRGELVPVADLALLLGASRPAGAGRYLTVAAGDHRVALAVDGVLGVGALAATDLAALPPLLQDAAVENVSTLARLDGRLLEVLSTARVLSSDHWRTLADEVAKWRR